MESKVYFAVGDIHGQVGNISRIPGIGEADGVIVTGDMTNHGGREAIQGIIEAVERSNPRIYAQIGNMDLAAGEAFLEERGMNIHRKGFYLVPEVGLVAVGRSSPTPFSTPSEVPEAMLGQWLEEAYEQVRGARRLVVISHDPPSGTRADDLGGGRHVGSPSVRAFVERVRPDVVISGHIHEARSEDHIGATKVINPGLLSQGGYVRLECSADEVRAELMTI